MIPGYGSCCGRYILRCLDCLSKKLLGWLDSDDDRLFHIRVFQCLFRIRFLSIHTTRRHNEAIDASISELENAITSLRNMASEFGNNYSIVENRENFTESLINVLEEGSDKLTLADMNEESWSRSTSARVGR